jgi:hypothetical protein
MDHGEDDSTQTAGAAREDERSDDASDSPPKILSLSLPFSDGEALQLYEV